MLRQLRVLEKFRWRGDVDCAREKIDASSSCNIDKIDSNFILVIYHFRQFYSSFEKTINTEYPQKESALLEKATSHRVPSTATTGIDIRWPTVSFVISQLISPDPRCDLVPGPTTTCKRHWRPTCSQTKPVWHDWRLGSRAYKCHAAVELQRWINGYVTSQTADRFLL